MMMKQRIIESDAKPELCIRLKRNTRVMWWIIYEVYFLRRSIVGSPILDTGVMLGMVQSKT
jgi:hypothetical protein